LQVRPVAGGAFGVEHRLGDQLFLAAEITASLIGNASVFGGTAEASWSWY
jgi:hypothetical protein